MNISFIIPAYNAESFIVKCVESILNLNINDFEIIVVDDGSTDHTAAEVKKHMLKWNRSQQKVTFLQQHNAGVSVARNHALTHASKEWITFVDADDLILPQFCEVCKLIDSHACDTDVFVFDLYPSSIRDVSSIYCPHSIFHTEVYDSNDRLLLMENTLGFVNSSRKLNFRFPNSLGKIYNKRRIIDPFSLRFPIGVKNGEDLLFNLQVWEHAGKVVACHFPVYLYYTNMNSLTHRYKPDMDEITRLFFNNLLPIVKRHPSLWPQYHSSKINNFFIECNQFLFHPKNTSNIKQKYISFTTVLNGYYHESFHYNNNIQIPQKRLEYLIFLLIRKRIYHIAFTIFYMKFVIKRIISK